MAHPLWMLLNVMFCKQQLQALNKEYEFLKASVSPPTDGGDSLSSPSSSTGPASSPKKTTSFQEVISQMLSHSRSLFTFFALFSAAAAAAPSLSLQCLFHCDGDCNSNCVCVCMWVWGERKPGLCAGVCCFHLVIVLFAGEFAEFNDRNSGRASKNSLTVRLDLGSIEVNEPVALSGVKKVVFRLTCYHPGCFQTLSETRYGFIHYTHTHTHAPMQTSRCQPHSFEGWISFASYAKEA